MRNNWRESLAKIIPSAHWEYDVPLSGFTSMKVGGPADMLLSAESAEQVAIAVRACHELDIPCFVMGCGSNLIVRDSGIRGLALHVGKKMSRCEIRGKKAIALAGCKLPLLAREAIQKNLIGLEFAGGIPGSVGGAINMNAGAYGGEIKDCLTRVQIIDDTLKLREYEPHPEDFGHRTSIFMQNKWIITQAEFSLRYDTDGEGRKRFDDWNLQRKQKQPLSLPSAGSVFKRPPGYFAGQLIDQAGLKGASVGGAKVSELHAGFIVNTGNAKASDVIELIEFVQQRVLEHSGITLETEVRIVGDPPS